MEDRGSVLSGATMVAMAAFAVLLAVPRIVEGIREMVFTEMKDTGSPTYERAMNILVEDVERRIDLRVNMRAQSLLGCLCHEGIKKREVWGNGKKTM